MESVLWLSALTIAFVALALLSFIVLRRLDAILAVVESAGAMKLQLDTLAAQNERSQRQMREDLAQSRAEAAQQAGTARAELGATLNQFTQALQNQLASVATVQNERLSTLTQSSEQRLEAVRATVEQRLDVLRSDTAQKLEQMRATVDEKLHATLEQRLGESFKLVSERLEQVHRGLGEMQTLAVGVGDLKRVLSNVKSRGGWGEVQLASLLEEMLAPAQYERNVVTRPGGRERVEFALKLPGRGEDGIPCWLPIDAKFPLEDYQRLQEALERADAPGVEASRRALEEFFKAEARKIRDKYIEPPHTTDFAILFVPIEGLYAEAASRAGLVDTLQREYRVMLAGPMNLAALLNSLQLGFRTLAIEKRSTEVWRVLGAVKTEFGKFGELLSKTKERLDQVGRTLDDASRKSTTIARKLRDVEALPPADAEALLTGEPQELYEAELEASANDED